MTGQCHLNLVLSAFPLPSNPHPTYIVASGYRFTQANAQWRCDVLITPSSCLTGSKQSSPRVRDSLSDIFSMTTFRAATFTAWTHQKGHLNNSKTHCTVFLSLLITDTLAACSHFTASRATDRYRRAARAVCATPRSSCSKMAVWKWRGQVLSCWLIWVSYRYSMVLSKY